MHKGAGTPSTMLVGVITKMLKCTVCVRIYVKIILEIYRVTDLSKFITIQLLLSALNAQTFWNPGYWPHCILGSCLNGVIVYHGGRIGCLTRRQ